MIDLNCKHLIICFNPFFMFKNLLHKARRYQKLEISVFKVPSDRSFFFLNMFIRNLCSTFGNILIKNGPLNILLDIGNLYSLLEILWSQFHDICRGLPRLDPWKKNSSKIFFDSFRSKIRKTLTYNNWK